MADCSACPFAFTEDSEMVQNLGCLPTPKEIIDIKKTTGKNWSCHGDETRICAGFVQCAKALGLDYKTDDLASYSKWCYEGEV